MVPCIRNHNRTVQFSPTTFVTRMTIIWIRYLFLPRCDVTDGPRLLKVVVLDDSSNPPLKGRRTNLLKFEICRIYGYNTARYANLTSRPMRLPTRKLLKACQCMTKDI
jgi:hypothetical protein